VPHLPGHAEEGLQLGRHRVQGQRVLPQRQPVGVRLVVVLVRLVLVVGVVELVVLVRRRFVVVRLVRRRLLVLIVVRIGRLGLVGEDRGGDGVSSTGGNGGNGRRADIGVYGGSGLYSFLDDVEEITIDTPYGAPAAPVAVGEVAGRRVAFLPRHGLGHTLPPHRVPYRANAWAMRELGVRAIFGPCASGSLQPDIHPGEFVVADQIIDRTWGRDVTVHDGPGSPEGIAGVDHPSFAEPYDARLRAVAVEACRAEGVTVHDGGTVVVIQGPRFSTTAESRWYGAQGWHVINMTQMPEAVLATELGIPYAAIALITDYDAGLEGMPGIEPVTMDEVFATMERNADVVRKVLFRAVEALPDELLAP
jgi:5'-methylthioadenosine phosphorylase